MLSVTDCAVLVVPTSWVAKVRPDGEKLTMGAARPVPVRAIVWGLPVALSVSVIVPVRLPAAVGAKAIAMEQWAPAGKEAPQVFVCEKSPVAEILLMLSAAEPAFVSVTVCAGLAVPTG